MRRRFLQLVLSVLIFDAAVIGMWYVLRIREAPPQTQLYFGFGWMLSTLLVVGIGLKRFHAARRAALRSRR